MSKANAIIKFLNAARSLANQGMSKEAIMQEEMKLGKRESELESLKKQSKALAASGKKTGIYR